ncbi:MAG: rod shape-determining protein MreC [Victivallales bacterium]
MLSRQNILLIAGFAVLFVILSITAVRSFSKKVVSDFYHPYFTGAEKVSNAAASEKMMLESKSKLAGMVLELQGKNEMLSAKMKLMNNLREENTKLRELVGVGKIPYFTCLKAEIIRRDPARWYEKLIIDKGEADGIREGSSVISKIPGNDEGTPSFAVVGRVKSVSKHEAVVSTILSDDCALSVLVSGSKAHGIAGSGKKIDKNFIVKIKFLPKDVTYSPGEFIYTSGLSGITPSSLMIGRLAEDKEGRAVRIKDNLYAEAWMEPAANFDNLHFLLILVPEK